MDGQPWDRRMKRWSQSKRGRILSSWGWLRKNESNRSPNVASRFDVRMPVEVPASGMVVIAMLVAMATEACRVTDSPPATMKRIHAGDVRSRRDSRASH